MNPFIENPIFLVVVGSLLALFTLLVSLRLISLVRKQQRVQHSIVDLINAELPQTQCGQCSYAGCLPYARAIAKGEAINKCAPGGTQTIRRLSWLLNEQQEPVDPAHGTPTPTTVAVIREEECIGCTKCIQACPVDAILGATKLMHTVIAAECTGCDLCVDPCPVDCIDMIEVQPSPRQWPSTQPSGVVPC
ncbi:MAG: electron transport complex subunit RsxB [Pseudomonadales bacterium]|nr:electron transport complex subunit RsxB [Pseudomonadales bacterium]